MRLSKASYFADFVVYPPLVLTLVIAAIARPAAMTWIDWIDRVAAFLVGIGLWTFLEYIFHRFVLHHVRPFSGMHDMHHDNPRDLVGTPTWFSLLIILAGIMFPLWWNLGYEFASAVTAGLMLGYLWYVGIHHAVHHWRIDESSYLYKAKRRHALHHYGRQPCNFGVSTSFWDHVFGTLPERRRERRPS